MRHLTTADRLDALRKKASDYRTIILNARQQERLAAQADNARIRAEAMTDVETKQRLGQR